MPSYYAHLTFDQQALMDLPAGLSELIEQERETFDLSRLGPDPLLFYQPIRLNAIRWEEIKMHRHSALSTVGRLRQAIGDGVLISIGYGAGFLCHLALDSVCHGYVGNQAADDLVSHMAIEGEYDRMLMGRDGLNAAGQSPLPSTSANRVVWEAAFQAFTYTSPDQMRRAYRFIASFSSFLTHPNGRITGKVTGTVGHMLLIPSARGTALRETLHPSVQEGNADLNCLLKAAIPETAEQITAFFQAISAEIPVLRWFDRDFKSNPPPTPQHTR